MKFSTYPPFLCKCLVALRTPSDEPKWNPDIRVRVAFYIHHWGDIQRGARSKVEQQLRALDVSLEVLAHADYEVEDCEYYALEPRGVRRNEDNERVEAFYLHDPKKRDVLIRQRRLVPESANEMMAIYGKPTTPKVNAEAVPA